MKKIFIFFLIFPILSYANEVWRIDYKLNSPSKIISSDNYEIVDNFIKIKYEKKDFKKLDIKEGDILISTKDGGFLGRVVSISKAISDYYIETQPVSIEEAFEYLNLEYKGELKNLQIKNIQTNLNGIEFPKFTKSNLEKEFNIKLNNVVLYDYDGNLNTTNDRIILNGLLNFIGNIEWNINIQQNSIQELKFIVNLDKKSDFDITLSTPIRIPLPFSKEFKLAEYEFMPVTIGPVVFTPIVSVFAGFNIGVAGKVVVNFKHNLKAKYGTHYQNGKWYEISQVKDKSFKGALKFVGADGWIKGYAGPEFKLNFYNRAGPYIKGDGYLKLTSDLTSFKPLIFNWKLKGGLEAKAGVQVKIFSNFIKDFEKDIARYEVLINSGSFGNKPLKVEIPYIYEEQDLGILTPQNVLKLKEGF